MNFKDVKFFEWECLVTKYLVLCGLEPVLNTHLESFIYAQIKKDSGWEISIYVDDPEFTSSNLPFEIRAVGYQHLDSGQFKKHKELKFNNLKDFKVWIDNGAIIAPEDGNIISGLIDLTDMTKDRLER